MCKTRHRTSCSWPTPTTRGVLVHDTGVVVSCSDPSIPLDFLTAWLNSSVVGWYAYNMVYNRAIRTMDFIGYYIKQLLFPKDVAPATVDTVAQLARKAAQDVDCQREIDQAFLTIYGLIAEDITVVDGEASE